MQAVLGYSGNNGRNGTELGWIVESVKGGVWVGSGSREVKVETVVGTLLQPTELLG